MKELYKEMWDCVNDFNVMCVTTNGFVTKRGDCVMGRGNALEVKKLCPGIEHTLGTQIKKNGNVVNFIGRIGNAMLYSFPVKPVSGSLRRGVKTVPHFEPKPGNDFVPGFFCLADIDIIKHSALELVHLANTRKWKTIAVPRPGSGAGGLDWDKEVKPVLEEIFDDRFTIFSK